MDLLKNNTSLKKYFGIIKTKKHRPPRASLTQGRPTSAVNTGSGNWGPPRVRATPSKHSCRDHDAALTGRQECTRTASLCPWKGFSCVTWIIYFHSYCFIRCPPGSERQSRPGDRDGDRLGTCLSGISDSFLLVTKSQGQVYFVDKSAYTEPKILQTGKRPVL